MEDLMELSLYNAPIAPPDMSQPVRVTIGDTTREYRIVRAERKTYGGWDLELEPMESVAAMTRQEPAKE